MRLTASPYRARILYMLANFVNDAARNNKLFRPGQIYGGPHGLAYPELAARG